MNKEEVESKLVEFPICEYAFIEIEDIEFPERVRYICEHECPQYGKSWSCPPATGTVEECMEKCRTFSGGFLFTTVAEVSDMLNMPEMLSTRMEHEEITRQVRDVFRNNSNELLVLSTESCAICEKCSYPDAPCRHPEKMFPCIESYSILVTELAERYGITYLNGNNVITWFSLILYR